MNKSIAATATLALLGMTLPALAQQAAGAVLPPPPAGIGPAQLHADRTITFHFLAPKASEVVLRFGEGTPQMLSMTKGADGIWSRTVGPVEPEIYVYSFLVDGAKAIDLENPLTKVGATIDGSVVEVPGTPPRFDQVQDVTQVPGDTLEGRASANDLLRRELLADLIPSVDQSYRTIADREHRAIAGLSAGCGTALNVGLNSLDAIASVAEFSTGAFGGVPSYAPFHIDEMAPGLTKDPAATNRRLKLFYMSVGTEDPRFPFQKKAQELLLQGGLHPVFQTFPGQHEWKVWRHSLADLAPRLFR